MKINSKGIVCLYISLYLTLLIGFYFNEDFAGGYKVDYFIYKNITNAFILDLKNSLFFYEKFNIDTSPIFILLLTYIYKIFTNDIFVRFLNLNFSLILPYLFFLCLKIKYSDTKKYLLSLLPAIIFISPYFRSSSIWVGPENLSIIFFLASVYFFLRHENEKQNLSFILLNVFFLALTAYIRPIYSLFSIYFFVKFYCNIKFSKNLTYYILLNILLSLPAFYYIFILEVNFFGAALSNGIGFTNHVNQFAITISIIFFYSIPIILNNYKNYLDIKNYKITNLIFSIVFIYLIITYFNYEERFDGAAYGGGIFYKFSNLIFKSNYFFYLVLILSFNILAISIFKDNKNKDKFLNFILLLVLIFLEPDGFYFHETYDPLLYFVFLLLINSRQFLLFVEKLNFKNLIILFSFVIIYYCISIIKYLLFFVPQA
jgi:hypothetical protein